MIEEFQDLISLKGHWTPFNDSVATDLLETLVNDYIDQTFGELSVNIFQGLTLASLYIIGLISCFGLLLISWFERSGQAGPFRSVINQLVSPYWFPWLMTK